MNRRRFRPRGWRWNQKLDTWEVRMIRRLRARGHQPCVLARQFNVTPGHISNICFPRRRLDG
jgi:hypothetical protein